MSLSNPNMILFDINGNPYGVSGSMVVPLGAIGQLVAGVNANTNKVEYLSSSAGQLVVTGSVGITTPVNVTFPSEMYVANFPAVQAVSGSQLTGSTFGGMPVVGGGVWYGSGNVGNLPAFVRAFQTDVSGALYVTSSGSLAVHLDSQVQVSNFPATQNVSGTVGAIIDNWPAAFGVSGSVNVYTSGPQAVTGVYQSGSVAGAPIFPVLDGGLDILNIVRPLRTDPQGRLSNPTTGSAVTSLAASTSNQTALFPNNQRVGATFFNEGPNTAFMKFGITATQANYTVQLGIKAYYELPFTYQGQVDVVFNSAVGGGSLRITELT